MVSEWIVLYFSFITIFFFVLNFFHHLTIISFIFINEVGGKKFRKFRFFFFLNIFLPQWKGKLQYLYQTFNADCVIYIVTLYNTLRNFNDKSTISCLNIENCAFQEPGNKQFLYYWGRLCLYYPGVKDCRYHEFRIKVLRFASFNVTSVSVVKWNYYSSTKTIKRRKKKCKYK